MMTLCRRPWAPCSATLRRLRSSAAILLCPLPLLAGCATNPATGRTQLSLYGEADEIALGRENDAQMVAQLGLYGDESLARYVQNLGARLAAASERPDLPWTFRVVDDPVVNAFALPGGFVYITRGILAHLGSEAELVGVLGHEIGHVTARHSINQLSKAQLAGLGLGLGAVFAPELAADWGGLAQQGLGLLFLKFGRDDERQADDLGVRYMGRTGYPPSALDDVFATLARASSDSARLPGWLTTHPTPDARRERLAAQLSDVPADAANAPTRRESYLEQIDGVVYGPDPRQGFFAGDRFYHPGLGFQLDFPAGWQTLNQKAYVAAINPDQNAYMMLSLAEAASAENAAQSFFSSQGIEPRDVWLRSIGPLPAVGRTFHAVSGQGELDGGAAFFELGGQVFRLLSLGQPAGWNQHAGAMRNAAESFARLTDPAIRGIEPQRLKLVRLSRDTSLARYAADHPGPVDAAALARLNNTDTDTVLAAGTTIKVVTGTDPQAVARGR